MALNSGDPRCWRCLREGVDATRVAFKRICPYHVVQGIMTPTVGAPLTHLRAWTLQAVVAAESLQVRVLDMTSDLEADLGGGAASVTTQATHLREIHGIAERLLHELFPDARLHAPYFLIRITHMAPFTEAVQIAEATADLAQTLNDILARCPCSNHQWLGTLPLLGPQAPSLDEQPME